MIRPDILLLTIWSNTHTFTHSHTDSHSVNKPNRADHFQSERIVSKREHSRNVCCVLNVWSKVQATKAWPFLPLFSPLFILDTPPPLLLLACQNACVCLHLFIVSAVPLHVTKRSTLSCLLLLLFFSNTVMYVCVCLVD